MFGCGYPRVPALLCALALLAAANAIAQDSGYSAGVAIGRGAEADVRRLFAPFALGGEVTPGWRLMGIGIHQTRIEAVVETPAGKTGPTGTLVLEHPRLAPDDAERTRSFALTRRVADLAAGSPIAALDALAEAVRANDTGTFWKVSAASRARGILPPLAADGILLLGAGLIGLLLLVRHQMRQASAWLPTALAAVVLLGAALRWFLAERTALGVWPYTRMVALAALIFDGPVLQNLTRWTDAQLYFTDITFTMNLVIAIATPLAIYAHGHYVLRDPRAALVAAALFAVLPNHIRFSHSEVEFILSLALTSLCLAVVHVALSSEWTWRTAATIALPFLVTASIYTRELNLLIVPLLFAAALLLQGDAPRSRLVVALAGVTLGAVAGFFGYLLPMHAANLREGLHIRTLLNGVEAFFDLRLNTFLNPRITPPGFTLLAVAGIWVLWRNRLRRHLVLLLAWFALYFVCHSFVLPTEPAMQARYHLHLAPPLVLLAAPAAVALYEYSRVAALALALYALAVPALHADFIRDTNFNDMHEYAFLQRVRAEIPAGCTVLEFPGAYEHDQRLPRMGLVLDGGLPTSSWKQMAIGLDNDSEPLRPALRELLRRPPECLYWFEGLPCWSAKKPNQTIAPACAALRDAVELREIDSVEFTSRVYDENLARGFTPDLRVLRLGLYRVDTVRAMDEQH